MRMLAAACLVAALFTALAGFAGAGTAQAQARVKPVSQARALALINGLRTKNGLPPLKADARLHKAAQTHSTWMASRGKLTHRAGFGGGLGAKVRRVDYSPGHAWENVAAGQKSLEQAIASWMNSSGHRANILGNYTHLGTGVTTKGSRVYVVHVFMRA